jgi:hypothetical protein
VIGFGIPLKSCLCFGVTILVGLFISYKLKAEPFTEKKIELVTTFADQAVIATESAQLLNELRQRTNDLSEALEQQTAASEVLLPPQVAYLTVACGSEKQLERHRVCGAESFSLLRFGALGSGTLLIELSRIERAGCRCDSPRNGGLGSIQRPATAASTGASALGLSRRSRLASRYALSKVRSAENECNQIVSSSLVLAASSARRRLPARAQVL